MKKLLLIAVLLLLSCREKTQEAIELAPKSKTEVQTERTTPQPVACNTANSVVPKSLLRCKIKALETLAHNYLLKDFNQNMGLEKTSIYREVQFSSESDHYRNANVEAIFKKINFLNTAIEQVNQCNVKSTTDVGGNTYPRASITEIIFKSEDCAIAFMTTIEAVKAEGSLMFRIDKGPHSIFREQNIVYYISSGGFYMMEYYDEVEKQMKKIFCS